MVIRAVGTRHLPSRCEVSAGTFQENVTSLFLPGVTFEKTFFFHLELLFITQAI